MALLSYLRGLVAVLHVILLPVGGHAAVIKCREHPGLEVTFKEVQYSFYHRVTTVLSSTEG